MSKKNLFSLQDYYQKIEKKKSQENNFDLWPGKQHVFNVRGVEFKMCWIPPGTFMMGASDDDRDAFDNEKPQHEVTISRGFWMMETPVTQMQYEEIMGVNPSYFKEVGFDAPVEWVRWREAARFAMQLSRLEGKSSAFKENNSGLIGMGDGAHDYLKSFSWRLPTEAEWEYACRAGTTTPYYGELGEIARYLTNSTHPVGQKKANAWGLKDMLGNVFEWCYDTARKFHSEAVVDPIIRSSNIHAIIRGGSMNCDRSFLRVSMRTSLDWFAQSHQVGFRLVRSAFQTEGA